MKTVSDVIVVGGGPCGSFAALNLAKRGATVTVFEEHDKIGVPSHCAGHLSIEGLKRLGLYPLPSEIVENVFHEIRFHSPSDMTFAIRFSSPVTCAINRVLFDRYLAGLAEAAGVRYYVNSRVESLIIEDGFVKGVIVKRNESVEKVSAKIVVNAEGVSSRLLRQASLPMLSRRWLVNGAEAEVENVMSTEPSAVEVFLGDCYAPGFYAWLIPIRDGKAKVGLGAKTGNPRELLQRLMLEHPVASKKLKTARIKQIAFHPITLGGPIPKTYSNGFLAVGDVASHVKPTTGGGIVLGLTCAGVAAEVVSEALKRNDFSAECLSSYQRRCREVSGFDVKVMFRMRKLLDSMSDKQLDGATGFCTKTGLDKTLLKVKDIDFQGRSLLRILPSPRTLAALSYLFYIYLSANP
jgi:digeranylgeranylglycerophospholipid reductase